MDKMNCYIICELCVAIFIFHVLVTTCSNPNEDRSKLHRKSENVVDIDVFRSEDSPRGLSLRITTPSSIFKLELQHAPSILHHEAQTIFTTPAHDEIRVQGEVDPDVQRIDNHFFHNPETGSVLSVEKLSDGMYNVAGFLDHNTIISPGTLHFNTMRYRRAVEPHGHIVYEVDDGVHFKGMNKNGRRNLNSEQVMINSVLKEGLDHLYGKDAFIQELIDNHRDIDSSEEENEDDDDYKEVPSFFDTEEAWNAHQRQAEGNKNLIDDDKDNVHDDNGYDERTKLTQLLKEALFKKSGRTIKKFYTPRSQSEGKAEDTPLSRLRRNVPIVYENTADLTRDSGVFLSHEQGVETLYNSGVTESSLKQVTTLEMPSQIPRPYTSEYFEQFLFNQIGTWTTKQTTHKHRDRLENIYVTPSDRNRRKRQVPVEVNPAIERNYGKASANGRPQKGKFTIEVHAVVDASLYQDFNYNWKALQLFLLHFWQSVNTRFQALVSPSVQLKIKAISKIMFPGFQPFIENNRVKNSSDWVDVDNVLEDFRTYVQEHFELNPLVPDHDVVFLMTGENLCKRKADNSWSKKSRGIAFVRGACISARRFQSETYDVGISEVGRSFSGVLTTTHELAHLLKLLNQKKRNIVGAFHDGEKNALLCPSSSGYIMGEAWSDPVKFNQFSQCSQANMKNFLETAWYANCLLESVDHKNTATYRFPKELPGQVFSLEEQCYHFIEGVPCKNTPLSSQCGQLCCEKWSQVFKSREPAADGTRCGGGKICEKGQCIKEANP